MIPSWRLPGRGRTSTVPRLSSSSGCLRRPSRPATTEAGCAGGIRRRRPRNWRTIRRGRTRIQPRRARASFHAGYGSAPGIGAEGHRFAADRCTGRPDAAQQCRSLRQAGWSACHAWPRCCRHGVVHVECLCAERRCRPPHLVAWRRANDHASRSQPSSPWGHPFGAGRGPMWILRV